MDDSLRFALLAEVSGHDESRYLRDSELTLKDSQAYKILAYNIADCRKHRSSMAEAIVYGYDHINLKPTSIKDIFIMETALNYLALHSFPEYYLNPLAIDPNYNGEVTSIGELMITYHGKERAINDVIMDDGDTPANKKAEVNLALDGYLSDMNRIIDNSRESFLAKQIRQANSAKGRTINILDDFFLIFANVFFFILFTSDFGNYRPYLAHFDASKGTSYFILIFTIAIFLYDIAFSWYHSYKARVEEPYRYAMRFLRRNADAVYQDVKNAKERLFDYIAGAINNRILLKDDIKKFSKLSNAYIDFSAIAKVAKRKQSIFYRILANACWSLRLAAFVSMILLTIVLIVNGVFNTVI